MVAAERSAQALVPVLASVATRPTRGPGRPGREHGVRGRGVGHRRRRPRARAPAPVDAAVTLARRGGPSTTDVPGGRRLLVPVVVPDGSHRRDLGLRARAALDHGVGLGLAAAGRAQPAAAGRGGGRRRPRGPATVVRPVADLARDRRAARRRATSTARVEPAGPPEIVEVGDTLNRLAERIVELLAAERELVADLSHRLRTPITALRLDAERLADPDERQRVDERRRRGRAVARRRSSTRPAVRCTDDEPRLAATWSTVTAPPARLLGRCWLEEQDRTSSVRAPRRTARLRVGARPRGGARRAGRAT